MRIFPLGFSMTTMRAHQSVGCSTLVMTPSRSIRSSSSFTSGRRGIATLRTTLCKNGVALGWSLMEYGWLSFPKPSNSRGNSAMGPCSIDIAPALTTTPSASMAGRPRSCWCSPLTMYTSWCVSWVPNLIMPLKYPVTGRTWLLGPLRLRGGGEREGLCVSSDITVTSAPVSMRNLVFCPLSWSVTIQLLRLP